MIKQVSLLLIIINYINTRKYYLHMNQLVPSSFYRKNQYGHSLEYMVLGLRIKYQKLNEDMAKDTKGQGTIFGVIPEYKILYTAIFDETGLLIAFHPNRWATYRKGKFLTKSEEDTLMNSIDKKLKFSKETEFEIV
jgi:hypothetical protein